MRPRDDQRRLVNNSTDAGGDQCAVCECVLFSLWWGSHSGEDDREGEEGRGRVWPRLQRGCCGDEGEVRDMLFLGGGLRLRGGEQSCERGW